jgi:beta-glucosidase
MDIERVLYLRNYFTQTSKVIAEGNPVKGSSVRSLPDNYEWARGHEKRFGLVYVDFATQKRTPKLSAKFYSNVIRDNRVV